MQHNYMIMHMAKIGNQGQNPDTLGDLVDQSLKLIKDDYSVGLVVTKID